MPVSKFGSRCEMPEKDVRRAVERLKLKEIALAASKAKDQRLLVATNGTKCQRLKIAKLDDAPRAGTKDSGRCTLVLTEGDSAKTFVTAGVGGLDLKERQYYGSFPLRVSRCPQRDIWMI